ncbi:MAG: hypothetical protein AAF483_02400 [Planctomycetota bacterium]
MKVHVRFDGQSLDFSLHELDLGKNTSDRQVKRAVASRLGLSDRKFHSYVVDRNGRTGDLTLRPQAVFG